MKVGEKFVMPSKQAAPPRTVRRLNQPPHTRIDEKLAAQPRFTMGTRQISAAPERGPAWRVMCRNGTLRLGSVHPEGGPQLPRRTGRSLSPGANEDYRSRTLAEHYQTTPATA